MAQFDAPSFLATLKTSREQVILAHSIPDDSHESNKRMKKKRLQNNGK